MLTNLESEFYNLLEGGILIIALYHIIIYFKNKQKIFLFYSLYFLSLFGFFFIATSRYFRDLGFDYFWGFYLSYIFYIIFTRELLQTKKRLKNWDKYLKIALYFAISYFVLYIISTQFSKDINNGTNDYLFEIFYITFLIFAVITYFKVYKLKNKVAYYFIIGSSIYIFLALTTNLIFAFIGQEKFAELFGFSSLLFSYSGMYIEAIMFAIIVGDKQKHIENERNTLAEKNLKIKSDKELLENKFELLQNELNNFKTEKLNNNATIENTLINLKSKAILNSIDVLYIKSDGHYVEYFTDKKNNPEIDRNSLNEVLKILPPSSFIRIHKSFIVNIYRIKIINSTKVMLDNGVWINLSRTYKQKLKDILHKED